MRELMSKRYFKGLLILMFAVIFSSFQFGTVLAENATSGRTVLESGQTLNETGFFSGDNIRIDGNVNGTTFAGGSNVDVSGIIDGDLFVAGQNVTVSGKVTGSIFVASQNITINNEVGNNIYAAGSILNLKSVTKGSAFLAGQKITLEKGSKVDRDLFVAGSQILELGDVGGSFYSGGDNVTLSGVVGKNAKIEATDVYIESATINGDLKYSSTNKATISNDSKIVGKTDWDQVKPQQQQQAQKPAVLSLAVLIRTLISMAGALLVWFIIKLLRPRFWESLAGKIISNPFKSLGFGALALIITPTAIIFLLFTVIGIPLALILASLYGIALYISKIIAAVYIGSLLQNKLNLTNKYRGVFGFLIGLIILSILGIIPYLSILIYMYVIFIGFGSLVLYATNRYQ